jgi:lipopolysaccharide export system permease protein
MTRILDRLVVRSFLKVFLSFVLGSPVLFILADATENLEDYLGQGLSWLDMGQAYLFKMPQFIQYSFPIGALVASVFTIQSMTMHREIVAAKAGGISFHRLVAPLAVIGAILTVFALGLEEIVPRGNRIASEILQQEDGRSDWRNNFAFQSEGGQNFSMGRLNVAQGTIQNGIVMEEISPATGRPVAHVFAESATYEPEVGWTFHEGFFRMLSEDPSQDLTYQFQNLQTRGFRERPEDLLEDPRRPEEMTFREMGRFADILRRSGNTPYELLVDRQGKLAIPVATLVIILFGAPLATTTKRGGTAFGIGLALMSTILYLLLFRVSSAIGDTGAISPYMAAWLPNALFLGTGLFFLSRVRT